MKLFEYKSSLSPIHLPLFPSCPLYPLSCCRSLFRPATMLERSHKYHTFPDPPPAHKPWRLPGATRRPSLSSSPPPLPSHELLHSTSAAHSDNAGNVDKVLFKNLVEMVPLVESLMDRRANSCFKRRASLVYTPAPSQSKKVSDLKCGKTSQIISAKKQRDLARIKENGTDGDFPIFSSWALDAQNALKEREELIMLREEVNDLQRKLLEKDEALRLAEIAMDKMNAAYASIEELRRQVAEKDSLIKSINTQLYNAKIILADKQAALEKLTWEAKISSKKIEELQGEIISMNYENDSLVQIYEKLCIDDSALYPDNSVTYDLEPLPVTDDPDEIEIERMEEARAAYVAALSAAKVNPCYESLAIAAEARLRLQALVS